MAGVDGCRAGWVVATVAGRRPPIVRVVTSFDVVADEVGAGSVAHVSVDMPIGLAAAGPRPCDLAARRLLGPRRSSIFPAPARAVLGAATFAEALDRSRQATGRGLPLQAFHLLARIAEVDAAVRRVGQARITETHPELGFAALAGAPLAHPKRHPEGAAARWSLLEAAVPGSVAALRGRPPGCRADDVADALVLAWSARRLHDGDGVRLGDELDSTGLRMKIAW